MWKELDFSLRNLHHVVKIWLFTTKFTPRGENWNFHYKIYITWWKLQFSLQIYTTWWKFQFSLQIYTTWWKLSPQIYTMWWKISLQNFHHMWWKWQFSLHLHYMVKIFTTKFTPRGENSNIYTACSEKLSHFHHIIYTTCGENYTVKSKIGLTSLMSGVQLKIFQVVVKIIISCHLVLKNFIWYQCCL